MKSMVNHNWQEQIGKVILNSIRYLVLCIALIPPWLLLFGILASEPPLWQKVLGIVLFPLGILPWPESAVGAVICLLSNAVLWGIIAQFVIRLRSFRHLRN